MIKTISLLLVGLIFSGCSYATVRLMYSDARVLYDDGKYVLHEIQESKK